MTTRILAGHVLDVLADLPADSVHMVWTSPPYWGLRSYGTEPQVWPTGWKGEHGLEPEFALWLAHEVEIFRAVRRVLRPDGTLWVNIGDAYATTPNGRSASDQKAAGTDNRTFRDKPVSTISKRVTAGVNRDDVDVGGWGASDDSLRWRGGGHFKAKDRMLMPARLAIALQEDGWWLRDEIVWSKANPMPSSVRDRTTPAHEMVYMFSKRGRYFYDRVAIAEPVSVPGCDDGSRVYGGVNKAGANAQHGHRTSGRTAGWKRPDGWDTGEGAHGKVHRNGREKGEPNATEAALTRNKRSVWHMALEPYSGAHFATAPTGIVRPCILAGSSSKGVCPHCGAPWVRVTATEYQKNRPSAGNDQRARGEDHFCQANGTSGWRGNNLLAEVTTTGWQPSCACPDNAPVPATVLDPFGGSGTTALVAGELGRDAVLIELNPDYAAQAQARLRGGLHRVEGGAPDRPDGLPLFAGME